VAGDGVHLHRLKVELEFPRFDARQVEEVLDELADLSVKAQIDIRDQALRLARTLTEDATRVEPTELTSLRWREDRLALAPTRIEDLVVSRSARGLGMGKALMLRAMDAARQGQAHVLDLTSNPSRKEANALYVHLGFRRWVTNVYRKVLDV
jgi:GNAT superfamily N-acetyltransferase